jgi:broad specificity phosphatase PhoE/ribonuclease HI
VTAGGRRLVVEADGGSRGNPGPAGYGAVVKDASTGEVLAELAEAIGVATNNVAEYGGLVAGLRAAARIDPGAAVEVRMDSRLVVEQMSGRWRIKHDDMRRLAGEARAALPASQVRYTWVPREQNTHADRLANEAMDAAAAGRAWSSRPSSGAGGTLLPGSRSSAAAAPRASVPRPDGEPVTLVIARHGRTADTERGVFAGRDGADLPLSTAGEADAARLALALSRLGTDSSPVPGVPPVRAVVTSPMLRAQRTATVVAERLGLGVAVDEGWAEMRFGAWEALTYAEIMRRDPQALGAWWGDPTVAPPDGESFDALALRVRAARERAVAAHPGESVAVLSHGGPVRVLVRDALEGGPAVLWRLRVAPCALTVIRYWPDGGLEVVTVNATPADV